MQNLQPFIDSLQKFAQKRLGFEDPPKLFLKQDQENAKNVFGKTAHYDPSEKSITIFTTGRHPKDILRSIAHELVHHCQNLRGDLNPEKCGDMSVGYAQQNDHMREMEREAFEKGNLCFRDWEDGIKVAMQQENNQLKENNKMVKISKKELKGLIGKILEAKIEEQKKKLPKDAQAVIDVATQVSKELSSGDSESEKSKPSPNLKKRSSVYKKAAAQVKAAADDVKKTATSGGMQKEEISINAPAVLSDDVEGLEEAGCNSHKRDDKELEEKKEKCCGRNNCEHPRDDHLIKEEELEEGKGKECPKCNGNGCAHCDGKGYHKEELEEAEMTAKQKKFAALAPPEDKITYADKIAGATKSESKIQTPEQEKRLYESRFNKRNDEIFDKLKKLWTK